MPTYLRVTYMLSAKFVRWHIPNHSSCFGSESANLAITMNEIHDALFSGQLHEFSRTFHYVRRFI